MLDSDVYQQVFHYLNVAFILVDVVVQSRNYLGNYLDQTLRRDFFVVTVELLDEFSSVVAH